MSTDTATANVVDHLLQEFPGRLTVTAGKLNTASPEPLGDLQFDTDPTLTDKEIHDAAARYFASKGYTVDRSNKIGMFLIKEPVMLSFYTTRYEDREAILLSIIRVT